MVFVEQADAARAQDDLRADRYRTRTEREGSRWVVIAERAQPESEAAELREEDELSQLAERHGGRYEGSVLVL